MSPWDHDTPAIDVEFCECDHLKKEHSRAYFYDDQKVLKWASLVCGSPKCKCVRFRREGQSENGT